nr:MAG TPA: hypothetical protein [Bacteriophage sp.]DAX07243.1 MAG TPA: hypothetical protein [Bacteriophage sp.]
MYIYFYVFSYLTISPFVQINFALMKCLSNFL